jgi:hypothetical protein
VEASLVMPSGWRMKRTTKMAQLTPTTVPWDILGLTTVIPVAELATGTDTLGENDLGLRRVRIELA